jgi:hypothetical protein
MVHGAVMTSEVPWELFRGRNHQESHGNHGMNGTNPYLTAPCTIGNFFKMALLICLIFSARGAREK